ncbi:hypothetical protein I0C86_21740 [Plantactinospora sp. S1510]|uniref:Uncharacterized protein n=1 Tax=Plantactinospora alkalitolerans TaxID=2789879 RepID=A0ABS0GZG6_9ACTN|nr:hypothetical protein [Plantactinospora alkalitolerans]MBF9131565.1 hypothetical protein [Plantactinospora alkalitolerans]
MMSAIASLILLDRSRIPELAGLASTSPSLFHQYLAEHGHEPADYGWSGYCMLLVLNYLEERGVDLESPELDVESTAISAAYGVSRLITSGDENLLHQLDPAGHSAAELAAHFAEMGLEFEESGVAGFDGLTLLRDSIAQLRDDQVLLLHIG